MQHDKDAFLAAATILVFLVVAILGWVKLKYGFNLIDEGMYMTDGWRLAAGDQLFPDNAMSAVRLYVVFNALFFKLFSDITLLEFRQLQYVLSLLAIIIFGYAIYRWTRKLWPIPLAMAVFAFTGLDSTGNCSNMSYYTYPHLFIVLHIALLILALNNRSFLPRSFLFIASGIALWGVGFSLLTLSVTMISPVLLWLCTNYLNVEEGKFSFRELLLILFPCIILWAGFIAIYNVSFLHAIRDVYRYAKEGLGEAAPVNYIALEYIAVAFVFWGFLIIAKRLPIRAMMALVIVASCLMFWVMESDMAGLIHPYYRGWFSYPMWFSALLITFIVVFFAHLIRKKRSKTLLDSNDCITLAILIPSIIFSLLFGHFSSMGVLSILYAAIPVTMALVLFLIRHLERLCSASQHVVTMAITAVIFPFCYHLAWADWKFTYFDLPPEKLSHTVTGGFAAGIKTNPLYASIIRWMETTSSAFSSDGEFAIIMDRTSMGYMLIKRRPSLNHSWTGQFGSSLLRQDSLNEMLRENRQPKIAYRFLHLPLMLPVSLRDEIYRPASGLYYAPDDPISAYIKTRMQLVSTFSANGYPYIEFYVRQ